MCRQPPDKLRYRSACYSSFDSKYHDLAYSGPHFLFSFILFGYFYIVETAPPHIQLFVGTCFIDRSADAAAEHSDRVSFSARLFGAFVANPERRQPWIGQQRAHMARGLRVG